MRPEDAASAVLLRFWDCSLPVNPVAIAEKLDIKVFMSDDMATLGGYYDQESGEITINANDTLPRQRFSVAHELGHCLQRRKQAAVSAASRLAPELQTGGLGAVAHPVSLPLHGDGRAPPYPLPHALLAHAHDIADLLHGAQDARRVVDADLPVGRILRHQ